MENFGKRVGGIAGPARLAFRKRGATYLNFVKLIPIRAALLVSFNERTGAGFPVWRLVTPRLIKERSTRGRVLLASYAHLSSFKILNLDLLLLRLELDCSWLLLGLELN